MDPKDWTTSVSGLRTALSSFLEEGPILDKLADILDRAAMRGGISYDEIERIAGDEVEDVLLVGFEWHLLLPVRAIRCGEWDDRLLLASPGEIYELTNIVKWLVEDARKSAEWNAQRATGELFKSMREPLWDRIPALVDGLMDVSLNHRISAARIKEVCNGLGLGDRVDGLIAELKGSGVMSPRLAILAEQATARGGPQYELNRCLFVNGKHEPSERTQQ